IRFCPVPLPGDALMVVQPNPLVPGFLGSLLLLALPLPALAADWPVARGPSREPNPYHYDPAQWKKIPRKYPEDGPACILYSGTTHLVEADGTVETVYHQIIRLNNRKGITDLGEFQTILYEPSFQKLTLNEARVLKANGKAVPVGPEFVQL